jgi:hypothetical protein
MFIVQHHLPQVVFRLKEQFLFALVFQQQMLVHVFLFGRRKKITINHKRGPSAWQMCASVDKLVDADTRAFHPNVNAQAAYHIRIKLGTQQCHSTTSSKSLRRAFSRCKTKSWK